MSEDISWRYPIKVIGECPVEFPYINHLPGNHRISFTESQFCLQGKDKAEDLG